MTAPADPTPRPVATPPASDPRPADRPTEVAGGKAHWDALTTEALATGGLHWTEVRDGYTGENDPVIREAELLPAPPPPPA